MHTRAIDNIIIYDNNILYTKMTAMRESRKSRALEKLLVYCLYGELDRFRVGRQKQKGMTCPWTVPCTLVHYARHMYKHELTRPYVDFRQSVEKR